MAHFVLKKPMYEQVRDQRLRANVRSTQGPTDLGNKATLPPTTTKSPPPQVKLVLVVTLGAVVPNAKA
ncbi:hypothetical protein Lal_00033876 [Lupinus albus]|nr:hypothetical protein Lal_00033876 [Lupinus albus]